MAIAYTHRDEDGRRTAMASHNGQSIEVVAGYDIKEDKYRFHVYVTPKGGMRQKVQFSRDLESTKDAAIDAGLEFAVEWIDANPKG